MTGSPAGDIGDFTGFADARHELRSAVDRHDRTDRLPVSTAGGRTLARPVQPRQADSHVDPEPQAPAVVPADAAFFEAGHRLRPSDLGVLSAAGVREVDAFQRPTVGVVPTGGEPASRVGESGNPVRTSGLTVSRYVEPWGGKATLRNGVPADHEPLRAAVERDLTKDVVVIVRAVPKDERGPMLEVVEELGTVLVDGVAIEPASRAALGVVRETPVLVLPADSAGAIVAAVQFLRPTIKWTGGMDLPDHPTVRARPAGPIVSREGVRTFAAVHLRTGDDPPHDDDSLADPVDQNGGDVRVHEGLADGWVVVPEQTEAVPTDEMTDVELWEYYS